MYKIAIIGGDGTGPEVVNEAVKVLKAISQKFGIKFEFKEFNFGGDRYLKQGIILEDTEVQELKNYHAILLGAIGHPEVKPGILEKGVLLKLRFDLDQYINLRPVKLYENVETPLKDKGPKEIDYVIIRENTGGIYTGLGGISQKNTPNEVAIQEMVYSRFQVERCIRYAFEYAKKLHSKKAWHGLTKDDLNKGFISKLTLCGKTNVLTYVFDLWERTYYDVAKEYPMIKTDYAHVDAICMWMVKNPEWFDVIVTENMFGDIITDLGAITQGGLGLAAGGNINPNGVSMFEPIGGSAPKYAGQNVINPLAAIGSAKMMLETFGEDAAAEAIENAMKNVIKKLESMAAGKMGYGTKEVGDLVAAEI
ncbi:MAG: 3-isopropylmalate dehydrogenase [Candidatus Margulisiibacteriota bacterium]|jgi:3-isopropylmalate dehydrogenase